MYLALSVFPNLASVFSYRMFLLIIGFFCGLGAAFSIQRRGEVIVNDGIQRFFATSFLVQIYFYLRSSKIKFSPLEGFFFKF